MAKLLIDAIRLDGGTQPRAAICEDLVAEYAAALLDGRDFPPVVVFFDGEHYWLADGFHRVRSHQRVGRREIDCDVRQGTRRDAVLFSVGANADHGERRTNEDKRRAVLTLLNDPEWSEWNDGEIAAQCKVSRQLVQKLRPSSLATVASEPSAPDQPPPQPAPQARTYRTKHGTTATMNTERIGKSSPVRHPKREPVVVRTEEVKPLPVEPFRPDALKQLFYWWKIASTEERAAFLADVAKDTV